MGDVEKKGKEKIKGEKEKNSGSRNEASNCRRGF